MRFTRAIGWIVALSASLPACGVDSHADRAAWLHATLVADRYGDLRRDPDLVELQFDKMEEDLFLYMRGTLPQSRRDIVEPFVVDASSRFLSAAAGRVQLVGDPHIENIGTFQKASGALAIEFNDFDSAIYGSYHLDVWRLALSWYALGASSTFTRTEEEDWLAVSEHAALGYAEEMAALAEGRDTLALESSEVLQDLIDEAQDEGESGAVLAEFTEVDDAGERVFLLESDELDSLSAQEYQWLLGSLDDWRASLPGQGEELGEFKSAARRLGSGVASLYLHRYYLLFEGASAEPEDDLLVEWKETRDPCLIGTGVVAAARLFSSNAERITVLKRQAHADPLSDRFAGWLGAEPWSFRSRRNSGYHAGLNRSRIERRLRDGRWRQTQLLAAGYATGQLLARTHNHAPTLDQRLAARVVSEAIGTDVAAFAREVRERVSEMGPQLAEDFRLFALLRQRYGRRLEHTP